MRPSLPGGLCGCALLLGAAALLLLSSPACATFPPVAAIDNPHPAQRFDANSSIPFSAGPTSDPDENSTLTFFWNFSGQLISGVELRYLNFSNYSVPGNYTIFLTVRDNESLEGYANVSIGIDPENLAPSAVISAPANGSRYFTTESVNLSGTGSFDPEGSALTAYYWSEFVNATGNWSQFGNGENTSRRFPAGDHWIQLRVTDVRGDNGTATLFLRVEVNTPPRLTTPAADRAAGFDGESFTFTVVYTEDNGEAATQVLLILDGSPHPMQIVSGADPRTGQRFSVSIAPSPGRHAFYALASEGNLTNLSLSASGPDVWLNITLLSADRLAELALAVLPPYSFTITAWTGATPPDPTGLVAVSATYLVNGSALGASNYTLTVAFTPSAQVDGPTTLLHLAGNGSWLSLVTGVDAGANTATVGGSPLELPATYRAYARHADVPPNAPPVLVISFAGDFYPRSTVRFDGEKSQDPENATLLLEWRFEGNGFSTAWLPGSRRELAFPAAGFYNISLRGDDGAGNVVYKNISLQVRERPVPPPNTTDEPLVVAALAAAVGVSAVLAFWWRGRAPKRRKTYEDQYGRLYGKRMAEETEYTQLFEKFAEPSEGTAPPAEGLTDPPAR